MAKQFKKALCLVLAVLLAFSCFAVSAFAYTGYDRNGPSDSLRVQSVVNVDKTTYSVGDTVTATITLNHPNDSVIGYQGFLVFDKSELDFTGVELLSGFEYFDPSMEPAAATAIDPTALTMGIGGDPFTADSFDDLIGYANLSQPAVINLAVLNLDGLAAGSDAVAKFTFEATNGVESSKIALVPSIVFGSSIGYFNCAATTSTESVYETAFSATSPSASFKITGGSGHTYWDITFTGIRNPDGSMADPIVKSTEDGEWPEAPTVPDYDSGDYHYTFSGVWSPALAVATAAATYMPLYNESFVSANYNAYNAAVAAANTKLNDGTAWTTDSVAALTAALNTDVSGLGRTSQQTVDDQTALIIQKTAELEEQAAVYEIKFEVKGLIVSTQQVTAGEMPQAPTVSDYRDDAKNYHFTGWSPAVAPAAGNTTYVAQFSETWIDYNITFNWVGGSTTVKTHWGDMPQEPTVPSYEDASTTYVFKAWNPAVVACAGNATYEATYTESTKDFVIKFVDENGTTILKEESLPYGSAIVAPTDPTKPADNTYTYSFSGWSPALPAGATVTKDQTYTATYTPTFIEYPITFNWANGGTQTTNYHYGETVTQPNVPDYQDNTYNYSFDRWDTEVTTVQGAQTYNAEYTYTYREYTISFTWANGGSAEVTAHWGDMPQAPTVPSYEEGGKTYSFSGWNPTLVACAGDASYEATYSSEDIYYSITFNIEGVETTQSVKAGTMPEIPELVNHADLTDGDYEITYSGWDATIVPAAGDVTYTALYSRDFIEADYSAVNDAIAAAQAVNRDIYTAETLAVLDEKLADVQTGLGRTKQDEVEAMAAAIQAAISALELKPADYEAYNAAVADLQAELQKDDYTPDSIALVTGELSDIDNALAKDLKIIDQTTVDNAKAAVEALWAHLVVKADKSVLKELIDQAEALDPDKYVDFSDVTTALANANTVYEDDNATNEEVAGAITALRSALNDLVKKNADYTAWNALEEQFAAVKTQYYTPASVAAVQAVLDQVQKGQDIDYQPTLDALTADLEAAINALELITSWQGETDWEGVDHPYFYSNLEFEQEIDEEDPANIVVKVYLNHPLDTVDGIQIAALYDAQAMTFKTADINNGSLLFTETGVASFNPADYGLDTMGKANVLKLAADFDAALAPTEASRDLVATLHFTATGAASTSYIKAVPLASNTTAEKSVYSAAINGEEEFFMHNDAADLVLAAVETGSVIGSFTGDNGIAPVTITLSDGTNEYTTEVSGKSANYSFENVIPGTYVVTMSAVGSLGFTVKNVVVTAGEVKEVPSVKLIFGDCNEDGRINGLDIGFYLPRYGLSGEEAPSCDVNGDNSINALDLGMIINGTRFGQSAAMQVITL